jgi:hypothetical protein
MFLGLPDPHPLVTGTNPATDLDLDPNRILLSSSKNCKINFDF